MKTATEYRVMAEECFEWARQAQTAEVRATYLQLAEVWLETASKLDGLSPTSTPRVTEATKRTSSTNEV
jgi:hypothetical protein